MTPLEILEDEAVNCWVFTADNRGDPKKLLNAIIDWHVQVALDPRVSSTARDLLSGHCHCGSLAGLGYNECSGCEGERFDGHPAERMMGGDDGLPLQSL
jgi:hypothetical protein